MTTLQTTSTATMNLTQSVSRHLGGVALNGSLGASVVALALATVVVLGGVFGMFASVFGGSLREGQPKEVIDKLVASHTTKIDEYEKRFNNRSIFYKPPMPPRPEPKPEPVVDRPVVVDTSPKIPPAYTGPSIAWVIGNDVYFAAITQTLTDKYLRIAVGEERSGLKVINLDKMPRTVRVGYQGGEYDVKVFGESTGSDSLFPTKPKPSAFVPGFIAADQPATTAPVEEPVVVVEETPSAELTPEGGANANDDGGRPHPRDERPNRGRGPRGERNKATPVENEQPKPDSEGGEAPKRP